MALHSSNKIFLAAVAVLCPFDTYYVFFSVLNSSALSRKHIQLQNTDILVINYADYFSKIMYYIARCIVT